MGISFPLIEADLGKRLTRQELSSLLGLNYKTICKHYQELGGIRIGNRYIFFERRVIDAIQEGVSMGGRSTTGKTEDSEIIRLQEEGPGLGERPLPKTGRSLRTAPS
jgi:hypothetical protein